MPLKVEHTVAAQEDLIEIWNYLAANSERAAARILQRIGDMTAVLAERPEIGRTWADLADDLRGFPVEGYMIFYRVEGKVLLVARVVSHYRDVTKQAFPDR